MKNPIKLPETAEQFLTTPDHLSLNKRINKVIDVLLVTTASLIVFIFIIGSAYLAKIKECNKWKEKRQTEFKQDQDQQAIYEQLKNSN